MQGPSYPNPTTTANTQADLNLRSGIQQTNLGRPNQVTPFGSSTWTTTGKNPDGTPIQTNTMTLAPEQQAILDQINKSGLATANLLNRETGDLGRTLNQPLNQPKYTQYGNVPNLKNNVKAGAIKNTVADAGDITRGYDAGGDIRATLSEDDYGAQRQQVEDALMGRVNTQYDRDYARREQSLASKGIRAGSEAYNKSMDDYNRSLGDARVSAVLGAGQEQNRLQQLDLNAGQFQNAAQQQANQQNMQAAGFGNAAQGQQYSQNAADAAFWNQAQNQQFGQGMQNAALYNSARQGEFQNRNTVTGANNQLATQQFNNQITGRNQGINEVNALRGGAQMQQPSFMNMGGGGVAPVDYTGQVQNQFNAQQQGYNNMWNGIGGIAGTVGGWAFSDERLKEDITKVGETEDGVGINTFRFKGSPMMQMGVIAQDVRKKKPGAVRKTPSGFLAVNVPEALRVAA